MSAVLLTLWRAAVIGLANGLIVARLNVHGFIATLGVGLIISGYLATNYQGSLGQTPLAFRLVGARGSARFRSPRSLCWPAPDVALLLRTHPRRATTCTPSAATAPSPVCPESAPRAGHHRPRPLFSAGRRWQGCSCCPQLGVGSPTDGLPGRLRPALHRRRGARRHPARRRQGDHHRHPRRCRDLRHAGQHHVRDAGQPVPQGRGPRRRHRARRRRLRPAPHRRRPARFAREASGGRRPSRARPTEGRHEHSTDRPGRPRDSPAEPSAHRAERLLRALRTPGGAVFVLPRSSSSPSSSANPSFGEPGSLIRFIGRTAPIAIAAIGQYFVIVSGEFDLSMGSVVTMQVIMAGNLIGQDEARVLPVAGPDARARRLRRAGQRTGHHAAAGAELHRHARHDAGAWRARPLLDRRRRQRQPGRQLPADRARRHPGRPGPRTSSRTPSSS